METAVHEIPAELTTPEPEPTEFEPVVFLAKDGGSPRIVRTPIKILVDEQGQRHRQPGITYEFHGGQFIATTEDETAYLRGHRRFNQWYIELGNEPGRPKPEPEEMCQWIVEAAVQGDVARVLGLQEHELNTHNRAVVLATAKSALDQLRAAGLEVETGWYSGVSGAT